MMYKLSNQELHTRYCPIRNSIGALFFVACLSILAFGSWNGLRQTPDHHKLFVPLFLILTFTLLARPLAAFTCFRERLVIGLVVFVLVADEVVRFMPTVSRQYVQLAKRTELTLLLLGLVVTLTMLAQSVRSPRVERAKPETSIGRRLKRNVVISLTAVVAMLLLGALLYFFPFR